MPVRPAARTVALEGSHALFRRTAQALARHSPRKFTDTLSRKKTPMATTAAAPHPFDAAREAKREPFKVKDLSLADFGRKEIRLAEYEMPG